jgi:PAS domain S-box-containing protein
MGLNSSSEKPGLHRGWLTDGTGGLLGRTRLVELREGRPYREFPLEPREYRIGRDPSNDIVLPDRRVSRFHARLVPDGAGDAVTDLGGAAGIRVNGSPVSYRVLRPGDWLELGPGICLTYLVGSEQVEDPASTPESAGPCLDARVLGRILEVARSLAGSSDLEALLAQVLRQVLDLVGAERGFIAPVEGGRVCYERAVRRFRTPSSGEPEEFERFSRSLIERALAEGCCIDFGVDPGRSEAPTDSIRAENLRAVMAAPLMVDGEPAGILYVDTHHSVRQFSPEERLLFEVLVHQAAIAIKNARLYSAVLEHNRHLESRIEERTRELRDSEARLRRLAETLPSGLAVLQAGQVVYENPAFRRMLGHSARKLLAMQADLPGQPGDRASSQTPPLQTALAEALAEASQAGCSLREVCLPEEGGQFRTVEVRAYSYRTADGEALALEVTDVTEARREQERRYHAQRLETAGRLASGVAHDFNNLLTTVQGYAELLRLHGSDPEVAEVYLQEILTAVKRGARSTRQLLALGRQVPLHLGPCRPAELVRQVAALTSQAPLPGLELVVDAPDPGPVVHGDSAWIHEALLNLVSNAREAMPHGGRLVLRCSEVEGTDELARRFPEVRGGRWCLVEVSDSGPGIPEEVRARLFEPFFTTRDPARHPGMGLATARGIVQAHGGYLGVETREGEGSTFSLLLPLAREPAGEPASGAEERGRTGRGELILLADDERSVRRLGQICLEQAGFRVLTARDGAEALRLYQEHREEVRLVLLDVVMPGMSGQECLRRLQALDSNLPVALMSGNLTDDEARQLLEQGACFFLSKPFSVQELVSRVRNAVPVEGMARLES